MGVDKGNAELVHVKKCAGQLRRPASATKTQRAGYTKIMLNPATRASTLTACFRWIAAGLRKAAYPGASKQNRELSSAWHEILAWSNSSRRNNSSISPTTQ